MALSIGNHHVFAATGNQTTPYTSAATTLHANTTAIVVCITIYDTVSGDGVVSDVDFGTLDLTLSTIKYDSLCDGHVSIWFGNSPQLTSQTLVAVMGGTCTDFKCSITEIYGGQIQEESVGTPATGTSNNPIITWAAAGDFTFACMLDDETDDENISAIETEIYITDVGDVVAASYDTGASDNMQWGSQGSSEDWVVVGVAYEELSSTDHTKTLTESVGVTDTISTSIDHIIAFAESVGVTDAIASVIGRVVTLTESVGITDAMTNTRALAKTIAESVGVTDVMTNVRTLIKTITENVGVTDAMTNALALAKTIAEAVGVTDTLAAVLKRMVTITDNVGITDAMTNARALAKTIADNVGITDVMTNTRALAKTITDNVGVTDALTNSIAHIISFADNVGITDVISNAIASVVNKSLEVKYDILDLVNKSSEFKYDIANLVNKSIQFVWDLGDISGFGNKVRVGLGRTFHRITGRRIS